MQMNQKCLEFTSGMYDLLLQNNASGEIFLYRRVLDKAETPMMYLFHDFEPDDEMVDGEYTGILIWNIRKDVDYIIDNVLLNSKISVNGLEIPIKELNPEIFLMKLKLGRVDAIEFIYRQDKKEDLYR